MEKVTLVHAACSLSMRIPEAIRAKPVSKLLRAWTKEYERRAPGADTAGLGLECDGSPLPLDAAIGSLAPGLRDAEETGDFAREPPDVDVTPLFATRRLLRIAERDGGARLGCATGGPCRVRRVPGSPPFPGFDARCAACFEARPAADFGGDAPELVSVVCPTTGDRASFHALLYANFARQERAPRRELVVFDTGAAPSPFFAALDDGRVRYVHSTNTKLGLGAKRNRCVELAAGAVVACFDDDNVYGPDYLRVMLAHLRHSGARCVCLVRWTTYSVADDAFYVEGAKWSGIHHLRSANGETLVYRKPDRAAPVVGDVDEYPPDRNVDEDRVAMFTALSHDLDDTPANIFLHMEHGRNTVPADSWDNCVEFRTPLDGDRVAPVRAALAAAASVVEAVARERARGPTRARPFVPKQRKFAIGKAKR
ncbi:ribonuclease [Aureococcus anophagefferens]|nr:ribonuclease [Aureococcus anophagefferens]